MWKLASAASFFVLSVGAVLGQESTAADPFPAKSLVVEIPDKPPSSRPERYIWSQDSGVESSNQVCFRSHFTLTSIPREATLYLAGPQSAVVYLNGNEIGRFSQDPNSLSRPVVFNVPLLGLLRVGANVLAVQVHPVQNPSYMPTEYMLVRGHYLVAKIVPASEGVDREPITYTDGSWRTAMTPAGGWQQPGFDDAAWPQAQVLGAMEGNIDDYQWNADGGLYQWPGYSGISPYLRHLALRPVAVIDPVPETARFSNLNAITAPTGSNASANFSVDFPPPSGVGDPSHAPSLVLDFGLELNGRLRVQMQADSAARLAIQYGESLEEAVKKPYLGILPLLVNPAISAFAQKTAFRFVKITFLGGPSGAKFVFDADAIYYPVDYTGSFESSDPLLNRIWAVGAYTAHLGMQDSIWDAPKRDRGRWMGDLDVSGRVIETAFDDRFLMEDTLRRLNDFPAAAQKDVNGIPGYSAMWVMGLKDYYLHTGAKDFLLAMAPHLDSLLERMRHDLDEKHLFSTAGGSWPFVDWSRDLAGPTDESRRATGLEYFRGFKDGAYLLREAGRTEAAIRSEATAEEMREAALKLLINSGTGTFGDRWQTNAMAIDSGVAGQPEIEAIRNRIFAQIDKGEMPADDVSPYYGSYILDAMAQAGDRKGALVFMREWWGGMLAEGATSFWEGYDPRWPKEDFHANLRSDGSQGYFVSLAHGWSSGPTAWLTEQILGIQPTAPGFSQMTVRPDLLHLTFARGTESTPHGIVRVDAQISKGFDLYLDLPEGIDATVSLPVSTAASDVFLNGKVIKSIASESGTRRIVELNKGGSYKLHTD